MSNTVYNIIREIGELVSDDIIKGYSFDWDDNILFMPTMIKVDKKVEGRWKPIKVSTEEFSSIRNAPNYKIRPDSYDEFRNHEGFIKDTIQAISEKKFGPSFDMVLSDDEKTEMVDNIKTKYPSKVDLTDEEAIYFYLKENSYMPVSSEEFLTKYPDSGSAESPEIGKKIALNDYVKRVVNGAKKLTNNEYRRLTIGFSDDDKKNIEAVISYIEEELNIIYPEVEFIIYDTSDKGLNRIVIEKS